MVDISNTYNSVQSDIIRFPGDCSIDYIKIYPWQAGAQPIDLTNIKVQINIFEDIFNNFMTGNISILEAWDLPMLFPIIGEEILEISFKRPGTKSEPGGLERLDITPKDIEKSNIQTNKNVQTLLPSETFVMKFRVIKMTNRKLVRDKVQEYLLHFVSPEMLLNKKKKCPFAFKGMPYSLMVKSIYNNYIKIDKPIDIEDTKYTQDLCVPYWTPAQAINIIASRSIPKSKLGSNYVFYESFKSGFHFRSLESLFEQKPKEIFLFQWKSVWLNEVSTRINEDARSVDGYDFVEYFDVLSNLVHGMYSSKLITFDPMRRLFATYDFDYEKKFNEQTHLEKNKLCTSGLDVLGAPYMSRVSLMSTDKDHDKIDPGASPMHLEEYVQHRQSQMQQLTNARLSMTLPGNVDRKAGDIIYFALPSAGSAPVLQNDPEKYLSGKYIITAIRHRIDTKAYSQDIEIARESFTNPIEYINPVPIYLNLW